NVLSVQGRTGAVVLTTADITGAGGVPATRTMTAGTGLTGGGDLSADRTYAVVSDTTTQRVEAALSGTLTAARKQLNFIAGSGQTISIADNPAANRLDITLSLSGTGPATPSIYAVNGTVIGTRSELNLIQGANTTITGVDNAAAGRVDITITAAQTPWLSDINGAGYKLNNTGYLGINTNAGSLYRLTISTADTTANTIYINNANSTYGAGILLVND